MTDISCRGAQPALEAAKVLDVAGIAHVCVGWLAVALLAFDANLGEVELVVRDKDFAAARASLVQGGFRLCEDAQCRELCDRRPPPLESQEQLFSLNECQDFFAPNASHLIASAHFHLGAQYSQCTVLSLYKKSEILRWIPVLEDDPGKDDPSLIWLSNDAPRLPPARPDGPCGPWRHAQAVRLLSPAAFCELLLFLYCRDCSHVGLRQFSCRAMFERCAGHQMRLDRRLRPDFQEVWESMVDFFAHKIGPRDPFPALHALRMRLIAAEEILYEEMPQVDEDAIRY
ncbi:uncharacterized protein DSM5745_04543 [Aspergillus mulundensis]|uniref:Uncharacterized protein n=1 Tax=Aspergillus mulundensis TaxID=1810919 RepID=A0A3D8SD05_9EURO|nr:hypothetical protein DSM5745_04543 [Aspergillus mulundensis]RDW84217.1 hypothetical protein DSM5745_04543 [Aspergillus mulundensis]